MYSIETFDLHADYSEQYLKRYLLGENRLFLFRQMSMDNDWLEIKYFETGFEFPKSTKSANFILLNMLIWRV